jgi:hypothetical protein
VDIATAMTAMSLAINPGRIVAIGISFLIFERDIQTRRAGK